MKKVFVDGNILLDYLDAKRDFHEPALRELTRLSEEGADLVLTEDLLTTVYYVAKDKQKALEFLHFVHTTWTVVGFGPEVIGSALNLCLESPELDLEDVLQALAARAQGCDEVLTRDARFPELGVPLRRL